MFVDVTEETQTNVQGAQFTDSDGNLVTAGLITNGVVRIKDTVSTQVLDVYTVDIDKLIRALEFVRNS